MVPEVLSFLATAIDAATGAVIGLGVLGTAFKASRLCLSRRLNPDEIMPGIRLSLGRWLALSLELALAADILRSVVAPTWDEIGKLAAIATLRTVLNYFLEKEIERGFVEKEMKRALSG